MVANAFDHRSCARVADGEALACNAVEECFAARRAVQSNVANDDVLFGSEGGIAWRVNDDLAARQSLAHIVVGVAFERECDALGEERTEALTRRTGKMDANRIVGESRRAVAARDFSTQDCAD